MTCQIRERVRVHKGGPTRQASVAERVERERLHLRGGERFLVLLLQRGLLDVASGGRRGEHPFGPGVGLPHVEARGYALRHWDRAAGILGLAVENMQRTIPHILPTHSEALVGA